MLLEALQQQVEKQAAMTELIRKIREPDALAASMPPAPRTHQQPNLEPPSPSASLSIDRDFAHGKVRANIQLLGQPLVCSLPEDGHFQEDTVHPSDLLKL